MPRAPCLGPSGCQNLSSANPSMCLGGTNPNMPLGSQNPSTCLGCGTSNSVPFGPQLGGVTPQAASMQEVLGIVGTSGDNQLQTLQQHLSERFVSMQQRRLIPERFGDRGDTGVQTDFVLPQWNVGQLPSPRENWLCASCSFGRVCTFRKVVSACADPKRNSVAKPGR